MPDLAYDPATYVDCVICDPLAPCVLCCADDEITLTDCESGEEVTLPARYGVEHTFRADGMQTLPYRLRLIDIYTRSEFNNFPTIGSPVDFNGRTYVLYEVMQSSRSCRACLTLLRIECECQVDAEVHKFDSSDYCDTEPGSSKIADIRVRVSHANNEDIAEHGLRQFEEVVRIYLCNFAEVNVDWSHEHYVVVGGKTYKVFGIREGGIVDRIPFLLAEVTPWPGA